MTCKVLGEVCKQFEGEEKLPLQIDLTEFCERRRDTRRAGGIYVLGETVRPNPSSRTGFEYECTVSGQVGPTEPAWPVVAGETITDGSVVWTCRAMSNQSLLKVIADGEWEGDGFTITDETIINTNGRQLVACFIGDDQPRGKYLVEVQVTFSDGHIEDFGVKVKVE
jgi:hypothetical protein